MYTLRKYLIVVSSLILMTGIPPAHAQFAVVDVRAIGQLIQQIRLMQQQLMTAQNQLTQSRESFNAMTGIRGMERLLNSIPRNYLPPSWAELSNVLRGVSNTYQTLTALLQSVIDNNAVLSSKQLELLAADSREQIEARRRSAALLQVISREALTNTSNRFQSMQELVDAIPSATDQKAILDLQARIQAEQGMLQNEQTKLQMLYQTAQAEEWARQQREVEQAIAAHGRFETRFRPTPR